MNQSDRIEQLAQVIAQRTGEPIENARRSAVGMLGHALDAPIATMREQIILNAEDVQTHQCIACIHRPDGSNRCEAFPAGIPKAIQLEQHDHRLPFPGDNGIRFTPKPRPAKS
ncbi:MAG TPA: hypothetical protein PKB10_04225 [Tepidisphaeraceae bacterium]|nr:hypothetical protein [Tepidisphaeraceae bacterium]